MKKLFVILAAMALVFAFTVPAAAVDWNFYGSARMSTWYSSQDFGDGLNAAGTSDDDDGVRWALQSNSRIGARVALARSREETQRQGSGKSPQSRWCARRYFRRLRSGRVGLLQLVQGAA